jgi:hypothetical protein
VSLAFASKSQVALHGLFRAYFWQCGTNMEIKFLEINTWCKNKNKKMSRFWDEITGSWIRIRDTGTSSKV